MSVPEISLPVVGQIKPNPVKLSSDKPSLWGLPPAALPAPEGQPYRRQQLGVWVYGHGAENFSEMLNLPGGWRAELAERYTLSPFVRTERFASRDGSVRYLFTLADGKQTEAVYMPYQNRKTVCVSSMVGCPAGCAFCATGALGFGRNLGRAEIVGQLLAVSRGEGFAPKAVRNVVLMGMGEALLNYDNALGAIRILTDPAGLDLSPRRVTLSTVGLPERIRKLAAERLPLVLAVSLHAPDDETRRQIIPTAHAHTVDDIISSLHAWQAAGGRRVTVEYTMLDGVNDAAWQAEMLVQRLAGLTAHVNLIPFNPWGEARFRSSPRPVIERFEKILVRAGLSVSVRFSRGRDTGGACGQLALTQQPVQPAAEL